MSEPNSVPRRGRSILLIVSLCLNIILIPVVAAVLVRAVHRDGGMVGAGGVLAPRTVMAAVPAERDRIQAIIDAHAAKITALRKASGQARREAFMTLAAPDFAQASFAKSLTTVANADAALERENIAMMTQSLAVLTPQERDALVTRTKAHNRSWFWRMFRPRPPRY